MRGLLLLLSLSTVWIRAQELRWGLHALGSTSGRDLALATGDATGFGLGLHAFVSQGRFHAVRVRLEGQAFLGEERSGTRTRVYEGALTSDWLFFLSGRTDEGPYTVVSGGVSSWRTETEARAQPAITIKEDLNSLLLSGGFGWQLGRAFGLEAQVWRADRFRRASGKAQGFTALFTIRF